eukprot:3228892-Rhodomonas_salina.1
MFGFTQQHSVRFWTCPFPSKTKDAKATTWRSDDRPDAATSLSGPSFLLPSLPRSVHQGQREQLTKGWGGYKGGGERGALERRGREEEGGWQRRTAREPGSEGSVEDGEKRERVEGGKTEGSCRGTDKAEAAGACQGQRRGVEGERGRGEGEQRLGKV